MDAPQAPPVKVMTQMLLGNRVQQAISVAAKLGIADLLKDGPKCCDELARATDAHPDALYRLLRALAGYGVFAEVEPRQFMLTPLASLLQTDAPGSLRPVAVWFGTMAYKVFGGLEYSVRTGEPAFEHIFGMEFFEYLAQHPEMSNLFDAFMARQTAPVASAVLGTYDFSGIDTLVDVGGGRGELIAAVLKAYPNIRGILYDLPHVVRGAESLLQSAGVSDRCTVTAGDMSESVPTGGDAYAMKSIVHSAGDDEAILWLRNCRRAMNDNGKLLLIEYVIPPGNDPHPSKLLDLMMLLGTDSGRERTEAEFRSLLEAASFRLTRTVSTESFYSVIEGVAA
jgi:hypothetical protein